MDETAPLLGAADGGALSATEKAAWIVDETLRGNVVPSAAHIPATAGVRRRHLHHQARLVYRRAAVSALLLLSFFEVPAWCGRGAVCAVTGPDGEDAELYMSGVATLPPRVGSVIELVCLAYLVAGLWERRGLLEQEARGSRGSRHFRAEAGVVALLVVDALAAAVFPAPPFRLAPYLRAVLPLFYWRPLADAANGVRALLRPFADVLVFWVLFVLGSGWICTLLFHEMPAGSARYWGDLKTGLLSSFIIATGADYPMQIMAVYESHRGYVFLFVGQVVVGIFLLFNFILAVVYNAYVSHIERVVVEGEELRMRNLSLAFSLVCADVDAGLTLDEFKPMVRDLTLNPDVNVGDDQLELIFHALDDNGNKTLSRDEFIDLLNALELEFVDFSMNQASFLQKLFPALYENGQWLRLMDFVRGPTFDSYIDVFMVFNLLVVVFESSMDLKDVDTPATVILFALVELAFSFVYIAEAFLKVSAMSWRRYWSVTGNRYDFCVMLALLAGAIYILVPFSDNNPTVIRYLVCLRCLRLLALLADFPRFRDLVNIFSILFPASVPLLSLFFLSLYFFSALGVQLFGGLIYEGNPALDEAKHELVDAFVLNQYMSLNLNDMASAWFMLFCSVVVCYLTEVPFAIASASSVGDWAHWFFLISFAVNTLIISNVVLSLVVDLFVETKESLGAAGSITEEMAQLQERYAALGSTMSVSRKAGTSDRVFSTMFRDRVKELTIAQTPTASGSRPTVFRSESSP